MAPTLFEIWDEPGTGHFHWKAQMVNYVANFPFKEAAERHVEAVKKELAQSRSKPAEEKKKK
jgi:hypothetical protein